MKKDSFVYNWLVTPAYALLVALIVRTVAFQPFTIPSESMLPTLMVGDYLFVSKFSYGYSRWSAPFGMLPFQGRILSKPVERGDVVVFRGHPHNEGEPAIDYIKRVVGVPGDAVQVRNGVLYLNNTPIPRVFEGDYQQSTNNPKTVGAKIYRETLPNGVTYRTLDMIDDDRYDNTPVFTVPANHYFMMGDNRDNSADSRSMGDPVGMVPFENILGKAQIVFFSFDWTQEGGSSVSQDLIHSWVPFRYKRFFQGAQH